MTIKTKVLSVHEQKGRRVALLRRGMESFEIVINKVTGNTEVSQAQYKKMNGGYEKEVRPKVIYFGKTKELESKYSSPQNMIENYMMLGRI